MRSDVTLAVADVGGSSSAPGKMMPSVGIDEPAALPSGGTDGPGLGSRNFGGSPKALRNLSPMRDLGRIVRGSAVEGEVTVLM